MGWQHRVWLVINRRWFAVPVNLFLFLVLVVAAIALLDCPMDRIFVVNTTPDVVNVRFTNTTRYPIPSDWQCTLRPYQSRELPRATFVISHESVVDIYWPATGVRYQGPVSGDGYFRLRPAVYLFVRDVVIDQVSAAGANQPPPVINWYEPKTVWLSLLHMWQTALHFGACIDWEVSRDFWVLDGANKRDAGADGVARYGC